MIEEEFIRKAGDTLDASPKKNWVEEAGGLPHYIEKVAKAIKRTGRPTSEAISIAISRIKVWATGKGVDPDTQAKAAEALAHWEAMKAKAHISHAVKSADKKRDVLGRLDDLLRRSNDN